MVRFWMLLKTQSIRVFGEIDIRHVCPHTQKKKSGSQDFGLNNLKNVVTLWR